MLLSTQSIIPFGEGFLLGMGLIIGIGPQNSFILQQAIRKQFIFLMVVLASLIDIGLIMFGAGGAASFFADSPILIDLITWAGVSFLAVYGWKAFKSALFPQKLLKKPEAKANLSRRAVIMGILAVSLLNPSTYLDTMFVIGGSAANYDASLRGFFTIGASAASVIWFFSLCFGATKFSKVLANPIALRLIDFISGIIMWLIAIRLVLHLF